MSDSSTDNRSRTLFIIAGLVVAAGAAVAMLLPGCNRDDQPSGDGARSRAARGEQAKPTGARCEELFARAFEMLQPDRLVITASPNDAVQALNKWLSGCAAPAEEWAPLGPRAAELLGPEIQDEARATAFSVPDARHVRDALLHRAVAEHAAGEAGDDVARVVDLFYHVVDNVALAGSGAADDVVRTPFETLLLGRGSAEDRAWVFAELLRQARIDAVILEPQPDEGAESTGERPLLVGVPLAGQVYLFDTRLGLPVPGPDDAEDAPRPRTPATLAQVTADEAPLRALDLEGASYPLRDGDLKSLRVSLVGTASLWAPRMRELQAKLSGERSVVVHEPLDGAADEPGLIDRVAGAGEGAWSRDDLRVWPYPEARVRAFGQPTAEQSQRLEAALSPLSAPVPITNFVVAPEIRLIFGAPEQDLLKARVRQLLGDFDAAILSYSNLRRIGGDLPPLGRAVPQDKRIPEGARAAFRAQVPPEIQTLHDEAAEDANYWAALAQRSAGNVDGAARTLVGYLDSPQQRGEWTIPARKLLALLVAEQGNYDAATKILTGLPSDHPEAPGLRLLLERWQKRGQ